MSMTSERLKEIRTHVGNNHDMNLNGECAADLLAYVDELRELLREFLADSECNCNYTETETGRKHESHCWFSWARLTVDFELPEGHTMEKPNDSQ